MKISPRKASGKIAKKNVFSNPEVAGFQRFNFFIAPHCP